MAYNKPYNPDALPRFAEPEGQRPGSTPAPAAPQQRYEKPAPPIPRDSYNSTPSRTTSGARPPASSRPPASPAEKPPTSDSALLPLFRAVDKDGTGQLSEKELSVALVNGDWTAFDPQTVRMMIRMFDADRSGTIGFDEFCGLWSFLASWRTLFDRFDADRSGNISLPEFTDALVAFRYRLSPQFVELLFRSYDKRREGVMSFDLFVQACISLKRMTDVFKKYDEDRDGYITLSFEDFLTEILKQLR
ncbi:peflin [Stachybotrys elegans]|uniref:Peflin n=1 Tax=Stachybotrys elegans TaxID=80388 RepID=A0A8K0WXY1_9HYPO|nr:peflin [Stachybotrys elegans]